MWHRSRRVRGRLPAVLPVQVNRYNSLRALFVSFRAVLCTYVFEIRSWRPITGIRSRCARDILVSMFIWTRAASSSPLMSEIDHRILC